MTPKADERLKGAFRRPAVNGWTFAHLEGTPGQMATNTGICWLRKSRTFTGFTH
jgi:hypothetical protein